jgi:hypothetical protein
MIKTATSSSTKMMQTILNGGKMSFQRVKKKSEQGEVSSANAQTGGSNKRDVGLCQCGCSWLPCNSSGTLHGNEGMGLQFEQVSEAKDEGCNAPDDGVEDRAE